MHLNLELNQIQQIVNVLTQRPYAEVAELVANIAQQVQRQQAAQEQPAAPGLSDVVRPIRARKPRTNGVAAPA